MAEEIKSIENAGKPGRLAEELTTQIDLQLETIVFSGQIVGITQKQLAEKFGVSRQTIGAKIRKILEHIPQEQMKEVYLEFKVLFDRCFRECNTMLNEASTPAQKEKAIELTIKLVNAKTELLERFHLKPKVVDNIAISSKVEHSITPDFLQELSKLK